MTRYYLIPYKVFINFSLCTEFTLAMLLQVKLNDPIASHVDIVRALLHIPLCDEPKEHLCMRLMIQWFCRSFYLYFVGIKILILSQEVG